jgi:hypothetical protein
VIREVPPSWFFDETLLKGHKNKIIKKNMPKKILALIGGFAVVGFALLTSSANAQLFSYDGSTTATSTMSSSITTDTTATTPTVSTTVTVAVPIDVVATSTNPNNIPMTSSGYIQLNGLTVATVSSASVPSQILAVNPNYSTQVGTNTWSTTTATVSCQSFTSDSDAIGMTATCPVPPSITSTTTDMTASTTATASSSANTLWYSPYTIELTTATKLLLANRTSAVLSNFTPGDTINVYGYYNGNGTINAEIIRDLSKPASITAMTNTTTIQAEIAQLETLVTQLEQELNGTSSSTASTTSSTAMCPMMTATSTLGTCGTSSSTASGTIMM